MRHGELLPPHGPIQGLERLGLSHYRDRLPSDRAEELGPGDLPVIPCGEPLLIPLLLAVLLERPHRVSVHLGFHRLVPGNAVAYLCDAVLVVDCSRQDLHDLVPWLEPIPTNLVDRQLARSSDLSF